MTNKTHWSEARQRVSEQTFAKVKPIVQGNERKLQPSLFHHGNRKMNTIVNNNKLGMSAIVKGLALFHKPVHLKRQACEH